MIVYPVEELLQDYEAWSHPKIPIPEDRTPQQFFGLLKGFFQIRYRDASSQHVYEIRPHKDHRGVNLISDVLPFGRLWYGSPDAISNAIDYAKFCSRSHQAVIRVYDATGNVIETHEHAGEFRGGERPVLCHEQSAFRSSTTNSRSSANTRPVAGQTHGDDKEM